jgi:hypothetical protein
MSQLELNLHREGPGAYRLLRAVLDGPIRRFEAGLADPRSAQEARLAALLKGAADTAFGREHGLGQVRTLAELRAAVPIRTGAEYRPYLDRVAAGERRVLTREAPLQLLETSGTTGRPKLLPVTRSWSKTVQTAQSLWTLGVIRDHPAVTRGKILSVVSPAMHGRSPGGLPIGSNTGRIRQAQPWFMRSRYAVPYGVVEIADPLARQYALLRFALQADVTSITTANPSMVLLLCRRLSQWQAALSADLRDGTLRHGPAERIEPGLRKKLERKLRRCDPPTDWTPGAIWPLEVVNCWTNGPAAYFAARLPDALGRDIPVREVGITASEGFFAFPMGIDWPGSVLWLDGHLLEFVGEDGAARWAWELEEGHPYRLVVSTEAGLWRYDLADTVEVVGWCGRAPVVRFVGKAGRYLNAAGERVVAAHVSAAMAIAASATGVHPVGFSARVQMGEVPRYEIAVEGGSPGLVAQFDDALVAVNVEYAGKRKSGRLGPPIETAMPAGTYARYRLLRAAAGAPEGQLKDPVLAIDDTEWQMILNAAEPTS